MPKYIYWRGNSVWCSYPFKGYPHRWPMKIKAMDDTKAEKRRRESEAEDMLRRMISDAERGTLRKHGYVEYNPKYWRIVGRYWYYHLRFMKSGKIDRPHLVRSLKYFGNRYAKDIAREDIEMWRQDMLKESSSINAINNRYSYLKAAYSWANKESTSHFKLGYDPTEGLTKLTGGNVRTFLLTKEMFAQNLKLFEEGAKWKDEKPKGYREWEIEPDPRFALFYLALWETTRRPDEVAKYTWDMVYTITVTDEGRNIEVHTIQVPPKITKKNEPDVVFISDRLWDKIQQLPHRTGFIFKNKLGKPWTNWSKQKKKLDRYFGENHGWIRDCRRGNITDRISQGVSRDVVKAQSGHKTDSMFQRYNIMKLSRMLELNNVKNG